LVLTPASNIIGLGWQKLVATVFLGRIYRSTDSGETWTETSAPVALWGAVASSADGQVSI
jgi:hypothetical protein